MTLSGKENTFQCAQRPAPFPKAFHAFKESVLWAAHYSHPLQGAAVWLGCGFLQLPYERASSDGCPCLHKALAGWSDVLETMLAYTATKATGSTSRKFQELIQKSENS